ncbi:microcin C ABC transporter permease YejB [Thalassobium sp. R2A62]|jgi:microcin C transport system permease protein|uniref:microcin C ABC transporter permease YejB n=1 Tax=Thalassobium sp. R2A62 TaxID=633131 RepID=UPI0001B1CFD1|nr:microcin C ABC transporter permease YejB [Thalassobium sp. R2A62]EET47072.1 ABC transporter, permease protein [Thalassobium sp. R2A62]MDG1340541.1 microcin C ABC transporter permease YejB [Paracoccaceae bacterium]MDG1802481.1 microcin C ABC transporter permease YejB [Paracoccaceae bacterium]MDG2451551.1 microcin C ABC transporter permease YejB [Paracoccaceae bacterium]
MGAYILRRLLLVIPTLLGILIINFALIQFVPGGPVEQVLAQLEGEGNVFGGIDGSGGDAGIETEAADESVGRRGLPDDFIAELEKEFGFDKPPLERFLNMLWNYVRFDFGESYFRSISVVDLVKEKLPVSISLGLWSTLIAYLISIPLGIRKAVRDGSRFDTWTSGAIIVGYAIPGFLFAILLLVLFAGGSYYKVFPLRGLTSDNFEDLTAIGKVADYFWHITLPVLASSISGFATLTLLTKNSFLDEIKKQYVTTAKAKGLSEKKVLYGHVFRNAMLIVIAGFPSVFIGIFFGSSLIIETIFSLDGLGRMGFEAAVARDYPVIFGTLFVFGIVGLVVGILSDLMYVFVDPRIDFERRG